jgi:hypothetical protein
MQANGIDSCGMRLDSGYELTRHVGDYRASIGDSMRHPRSPAKLSYDTDKVDGA